MDLCPEWLVAAFSGLSCGSADREGLSTWTDFWRCVRSCRLRAQNIDVSRRKSALCWLARISQEQLVMDLHSPPFASIHQQRLWPVACGEQGTFVDAFANWSKWSGTLDTWPCSACNLRLTSRKRPCKRQRKMTCYRTLGWRLCICFHFQHLRHSSRLSYHQLATD